MRRKHFGRNIVLMLIALIISTNGSYNHGLFDVAANDAEKETSFVEENTEIVAVDLSDTTIDEKDVTIELNVNNEFTNEENPSVVDTGTITDENNGENSIVEENKSTPELPSTGETNPADQEQEGVDPTDKSVVNAGIYDIGDNGDGTCSIVNYSGEQNDLQLPNVIYVGEKEYRVNLIEDHTFSGNSNIFSAAIPSGVEIGASAFAECLNLNEVEIADDVIVGEYSFSNCENLEIVAIGDNATIKANAFIGSPVKEVSLGTTNHSIESNAFNPPSDDYSINFYTPVDSNGDLFCIEQGYPNITAINDAMEKIREASKILSSGNADIESIEKAQTVLEETRLVIYRYNPPQSLVNDLEGELNEIDSSISSYLNEYQATQALIEAKMTAIKSLTELINLDDYSDASKQEIMSIMEGAQERIEAAKTIDEINMVLDTVKTELSNIPKDPSYPETGPSAPVQDNTTQHRPVSTNDTMNESVDKKNVEEMNVDVEPTIVKKDLMSLMRTKPTTQEIDSIREAFMVNPVLSPSHTINNLLVAFAIVLLLSIVIALIMVFNKIRYLH